MGVASQPITSKGNTTGRFGRCDLTLARLLDGGLELVGGRLGIAEIGGKPALKLECSYSVVFLLSSEIGGLQAMFRQ